VAFEDIDVMADAEARQDLVRRTGQLRVPVIVVDDQVLTGFDKAKLQALLASP
jgi:glutaredoxin